MLDVEQNRDREERWVREALMFMLPLCGLRADLPYWVLRGVHETVPTPTPPRKRKTG